MSARLTTVAQMRAALAEYPDDWLVVTQGAGEDDWYEEGTVDGPRCFRVALHEVRTGFWVVEEGGDDDPDVFTRPGVLISDMSEPYGAWGLHSTQTKVFAERRERHEALRRKREDG